MNKFVRSQRTAQRLIRENGSLMTFSRVTESSYDPVEGTVIEGGTITQDLYAVNLPLKQVGTAGQAMFEVLKAEDGTLTLSDVSYLLISTEGQEWELQPQDQVSYMSKIWDIMAFSELKPDSEVNILYKAYVRRT